jgi:WD40 repeat protein
MESSNVINSQENERKYSFCSHIKDLYFNSFTNKISEKDATSNFFNLTKHFAKSKLSRPEFYNISNNYLTKNISYNWTALYNSQSLGNNFNKDGCIFTLAFDDFGEQLASSNHFHNIEIWDLNTRKVKKILNDHKEIVTGIEYFHNERDYFLSCSLDKTIKLWKNYSAVHTFIEHSDWVRCIAISETNKMFLSGCVSSIIKLWDMEYRKVISSINNINPNPDLLNTVNSLLFMKENENIFLSGFRNGSVKVFDLRLRENNSMLVKEFKAHNIKLNSVKLNIEDKYILTSGRDSLIRLWDFRKLPVNIYLYLEPFR